MIFQQINIFLLQNKMWWLSMGQVWPLQNLQKSRSPFMWGTAQLVIFQESIVNMY